MGRTYPSIIKRLFGGDGPTIYYRRYNDGTEENPDILINRIYASIVHESKGDDICVYLSKEDDDSIYDTYELYRFPSIKNPKILSYILREAVEQSHCEA